MDEIDFRWDTKKNRLNQRKYGVSFEEAKTVFFDENAVQFHDPDHSQSEERFILLGLSYRLKILVVCHCFRENKSVIRIISARKASRTEHSYYEKRRQ
jgi:uncharacterized protein